jgi:SAM-dependent methyltransferase
MGGMTQRGGSVSFDRAVDYYDRTRGLAPETEAAQTAVLVDALDGIAGAVLEVGVGTGRVAVPLAAAGVRVLGLDLSPAMLARLHEKDPAIPLGCADATRLPVADDTVGAVLLAHVLHLVADWRAVIDEVDRVMRPGGVLLATRGSRGRGPLVDLQTVARDAVGWTMPEGRLDELTELDDELRRRGAEITHLPEVATHRDRSAEEHLRLMADNIFSWTWEFTDEQRAVAVATARAWVESTYGDPAGVVIPSPSIAWHRYAFPG